MPRYRRRRARRYARAVKPVKYSNETTNFFNTYNISGGGTLQTGKIPLIVQTPVQGMRKCKNFTLSICCFSDVPILFALVYVPQGTNASDLNIGTVDNPTSIYEPNQNVIISGVVPQGLTTPVVKYSPLARNLNSGDQIFLVLRSASNFTDPFNLALYCQLNYAITY